MQIESVSIMSVELCTECLCLYCSIESHLWRQPFMYTPLSLLKGDASFLAVPGPCGEG